MGRTGGPLLRIVRIDHFELTTREPFPGTVATENGALKDFHAHLELRRHSKTRVSSSSWQGLGFHPERGTALAVAGNRSEWKVKERVSPHENFSEGHNSRSDVFASGRLRAGVGLPGHCGC